MTTCGWTKGEWHLIVHRGREHGDSIGTLESGFHHDGDPMYWTIASVNTRREGWECNARLIAAAPSLYEALDALIDFAEPVLKNHGFGYMGKFEKARAALAAARGEG